MILSSECGGLLRLDPTRLLLLHYHIILRNLSSTGCLVYARDGSGADCLQLRFEERRLDSD
jgi:hypothetical protein